ncbi:calmodulin-binding protein 60 E [Eucalyptus grandis]|uniref:calmodulin-binding protein 60 E n=1 Tax=Eucalyptus grandis TaxID=71139 RepID=UPI00192EE02E|nr:calmodulin-binding protein 60 E [Eucalyptus grandis]
MLVLAFNAVVWDQLCDFAVQQLQYFLLVKLPGYFAAVQEGNKSKRKLVLGSRWTEEDVQRVGSIALELAAARLAECDQSETSNGLESDVVPRSCSTEEDPRRVFMEQLEQLPVPHSADLVQRCIPNTLEGVVAEIRSLLEATIQRVEEAAELADCTHLRREYRANAKSPAKNGCFPQRKYQLHFETKLPDRVFTKDKLVGEGETIISVALIDANTGDTVTSGWESSAKVEVVVLDSGFNKDEQDNWAPEEFESYVVPGQEGPPLKGNLQVRLKEGVAELGDLSFNKNSRKMKSEKRYPPALEDDVWRLNEIAKDGTRHQKLKNEGIYKVKDFLLQLSTDPEKLKEILGMEKRHEDWKILRDHARTCKTNWQLHLYYADGEGKCGAIVDYDGQLIGLIKNRDLEDAIVKMAFDNWNGVAELDGKTLSGSMQKKSSSSSSSHVLDGFAPGTFATRVGQEPPPATVGSTGEGHNGVSALPLPAESEIINFGNATGLAVGESALATHHQPELADRSNFPISRGGNGLTTVQLPMQSEDTSSQYATGSQWINTSSQRDCTLNGHVPPSELSSATISGFPSSSALPVSEGNPLMEGTEFDPFRLR